MGMFWDGEVAQLGNGGGFVDGGGQGERALRCMDRRRARWLAARSPASRSAPTDGEHGGDLGRRGGDVAGDEAVMGAWSVVQFCKGVETGVHHSDSSMAL